ncbi:hypothetical protein TTY48_17840 [Tsukamurella sp. TY48]|nr:hypothetical protein TTY48_17840 [Tsukamurella sp. TY48]
MLGRHLPVRLTARDRRTLAPTALRNSIFALPEDPNSPSPVRRRGSGRAERTAAQPLVHVVSSTPSRELCTAAIVSLMTEDESIDGAQRLPDWVEREFDRRRQYWRVLRDGGLISAREEVKRRGQVERPRD